MKRREASSWKEGEITEAPMKQKEDTSCGNGVVANSDEKEMQRGETHQSRLRELKKRQKRVTIDRNEGEKKGGFLKKERTNKRVGGLFWQKSSQVA